MREITVGKKPEEYDENDENHWSSCGYCGTSEMNYETMTKGEHTEIHNLTLVHERVVNLRVKDDKVLKKIGETREKYFVYRYLVCPACHSIDGVNHYGGSVE